MLKRVTAPARVLEVETLKEDLKIRHSEDDMRLRRCIDRAESYIDGYTGILGQAMLSQQWAKTFDQFYDVMKLDLGPLHVGQPTVITYYDTSDVQRTLAGTVYAVLEDARGVYVKRKIYQSWPGTYRRDDAVTVTFTVGRATREDVPPAIINAISLLAGYFYENTEAAQATELREIPIGVWDMLEPFRKRH